MLLIISLHNVLSIFINIILQQNEIYLHYKQQCHKSRVNKLSRKIPWKGYLELIFVYIMQLHQGAFLYCLFLPFYACGCMLYLVAYLIEPKYKYQVPIFDCNHWLGMIKLKELTCCLNTTWQYIYTSNYYFLNSLIPKSNLRKTHLGYVFLNVSTFVPCTCIGTLKVLCEVKI